MDIFVELTLIVLIAGGFAILMRILRQPIIVGYILAGIFVGPYAFNILHAHEHIELFSKIGITILLFIVGLSLNPKVIREVGKVSLITGIGQVVFTSLVGFLIALLIGLDRVAAIYVSIALTFSSTIIILKLLSDKGDLSKLYGKIAVGFLLVQDIVATIILLVVSSFAQTNGSDITSVLTLLFVKAIILAVVLYFASVIVIPRFSKHIAASQELLFLVSMGWGLGLASLFYVLGFSVEIGALIAGVSLSLTPFAYEAGARLKPLRDFFIVLFFILLGSQMVLDNILSLIIPAFILSLFVLVGNPIIVVILMNLLGYKRRTGFLAGLTVAQISEFSLILAALGFSVGHLSREILSLVTLVGLITIAGSTYFILYSDHIYPFVENILKFLELKKDTSKERSSGGERYNIILFGYDRAGSDLIRAFEKLTKSYLVVDFNPDAIEKLEAENIPCKFGDAHDPEFLRELPIDSAQMVISTIPDFETNLLLVRYVSQENPRIVTMPISHEIKEAHELYDNGASYVLMPHYLGIQYASKLIAKLGAKKSEFADEREKHILDMMKRAKKEL